MNRQSSNFSNTQGKRISNTDRWQEEDRERRAGEGLSGDRVGQVDPRDLRERKGRGMKRKSSAHLEKFAAEGNRFIHEVADELGTADHAGALRITRAVFHALRDRLIPGDAVQFAQGLSLILKGIYFEDYDISKTPVVIRNQDDFIDFIRYKNSSAAANDFPDPVSVVAGLRAVLRVLERNMDPLQVRHLKNRLHNEIRDLIDGSRYRTGK